MFSVIVITTGDVFMNMPVRTVILMPNESARVK